MPNMIVRTIAIVLFSVPVLGIAGDYDPPTTSGGTGTVHCDPAGHCSAGFKIMLSDDHKSILDKDGKVLAKYPQPILQPLKATSASMTKTSPTLMELKGCMRCEPECIQYDSNGKCTKTIQSCTWDFDC